LNAKGVMYGWDASPDQYWLNRLPPETPFENLMLCGHWTSTGPGVVAVVVSGFQVARNVLQRLSQGSAPAGGAVRAEQALL
jgi:phytoene dehydrogenase-like protein